MIIAVFRFISPANYFILCLKPMQGVVEKKDVRIPRLGILTKVVQKPRSLVHIQTKEKYSVPAKYRVMFKISTTLRKKVGELELAPSSSDTKS